MKKILSSNKGFTFIETVLTTVVLSVGFYGALAIMENSVNNSAETGLLVTANQIASEKVETVLADKTFQGYDYITSQQYPTEQLSGLYQGFTRSVTVTEVNPTDLSTPQNGSGCKKVDVTVRWGQDSSQVVSLTTVVTDYTS